MWWLGPGAAHMHIDTTHTREVLKAASSWPAGKHTLSTLHPKPASLSSTILSGGSGMHLASPCLKEFLLKIHLAHCYSPFVRSERMVPS